MELILCLVIFIALLSWKFLQRNIDYRQYQGFKDNGHWYFGNVAEIEELKMEIINIFPAFFRYSKGLGQFVISCYNPELIRKVMKNSERLPLDKSFVYKAFGRGTLLVSKGKEWKLYRRIYSECYGLKMKSFLTEKCKQLFHSHIDQQLKVSEISTLVDFNKFMTDIAYDCSNAMWFGNHIDKFDRSCISQLKSIYELFSVARNNYNSRVKSRTSVVNALREDVKIALSFRSLRRELDQLHDKILQRRKRQMKNQKSKFYGCILEKMILMATEGESELTDEHITALFISHHGFVDTMRHILSDIILLFSQDFKLQEKVRNVITSSKNNMDSVFDESQYLRNVYYESLRLTTPCAITSRVLKQPISFHGTSFPIGTLFEIELKYLQRNASLWDNPERFEPNRFNENMEDCRFLPFSIGERKCPVEDSVNCIYQSFIEIFLTRVQFKSSKDKALFHIRGLR